VRAGARPTRSAGISWRPLVAVAIVIVVIAVFAGAYVVTRRGPSFPSHWDAKVDAIAAKVEMLRGLSFKHPVKVNYLSSSAFEKRLSPSSKTTKQERSQIEQATALLRATGLVGAKVDLLDATTTTQTADTLAYYDFDTKQIYIRADRGFTIETRVTLAHELTHVLQDQHFDLNKLKKQADASKTGSSDALRALIEGDARRIEKKYLAQQSASNRSEYARLSAQGSNKADARTKNVPAVVETFFGAPYVFGPEVMKVLVASDGNTAVNDALTGATPSTAIYLDPTAINTDPPALPAVPALAAGEKRVKLDDSGNDDAFDPFLLYLMLSARLDPSTALRAADAYRTGSNAFYRRGSQTCFRARVVGINHAADVYLRQVLTSWTQTMPTAAVERSSNGVVFRSCDPGSKARTPANKNIEGATRLAASRDDIIATFITQGLPEDLATCAVRVLVARPDVAASISNNTSNISQQQIIDYSRAAGLACRANPNAGLPGT
jgi:hypothetical protein